MTGAQEVTRGSARVMVAKRNIQHSFKGLFGPIDGNTPIHVAWFVDCPDNLQIGLTREEAIGRLFTTGQEI